MKNGYCHSLSEKYAKMVLFGLKTYFKKFFLGYFHPPTLPMQKNRVKMVPKQVFTRGGYSMSISFARKTKRITGWQTTMAKSFNVFENFDLTLKGQWVKLSVILHPTNEIKYEIIRLFPDAT